jgi:hypothetical protein
MNEFTTCTQVKLCKSQDGLCVTRLCIEKGSTWGRSSIARPIAFDNSAGTGGARTIMSGGRTCKNWLNICWLNLPQKTLTSDCCPLQISIKVNSLWAHQSQRNQESLQGWIRLQPWRQIRRGGGVKAIHASGTPPTSVLTVRSPQLAASNIAMQNASVNELPTIHYTEISISNRSTV